MVSRIRIRQGHADASPVATFIELDLWGGIVGAAFVVVANGLFVQVGGVWLVLLPLSILIGALLRAKRVLPTDTVAALAWIAAGNWQVAVWVSLLFPFLWPVMALTVLMAVVLATPYVAGGALRWLIGGGAAVAGLVGSIGLLNDDGGVVVDIADELEFGLVVGALVAQIIPIGLIVWQNNQLQLGALAEARALNENLTRSQSLLSESRRRVVAAADAERSRIERDLHDGAQARLVAIGIRLRLLESQAIGTKLAGDVAELVSEIEDASADLRELSHGIYPPLLETRGLREAIAAAARRFDGVSVDALTDVGRLGRDVESALYFTCLEALSNASKHAGGAPIAVSLTSDDGQVALTITDDGPGFDAGVVQRSHGIVNMSDRIAVVGGSLDIESGPGGTRVEARAPAGG